MPPTYHQPPPVEWFLGRFSLHQTPKAVMASAKEPETNDAVVTSWMPITTAYPSVKGCEDLVYSYVAHTVAVFDPGYGLNVNDLSCLPKPATTWWEQAMLGPNTETVMSIGPITCPEAYYTARTSVKDSSSTLVACCPIGYEFSNFHGNGDTRQCVSQLDTGHVMTFAVRDEHQKWHVNTSTIPSQTPIYGIQVNGWVFAEETGTATGSSNACTATTTVDGGAALVGDADPGLTSGAKAGIGVGVAMGVIGLLSLLAGVWMMMRARRRERALGGQYGPEHHGNYPPGYGGWAVETTASPAMSKSQGVTTTGAFFPQSGYSHVNPGSMGESALGGSALPVELSEERRTELPASSTPRVQS